MRTRRGLGCSNERNLHDFACFSASRLRPSGFSCLPTFSACFSGYGMDGTRVVGLSAGMRVAREGSLNGGRKRKRGVAEEGSNADHRCERKLFFLGFSQRESARREKLSDY